MRTHYYDVAVRWTGNRGDGTAGYTSYDRAHEVHVAGKAVVEGSSDPAFRGDASRYNPEELLVAALSACHMLTYLHLCSDAGVVVISYTDAARGTMVETAGGAGGRFTEVVLRPAVTIAVGAAARTSAAAAQGVSTDPATLAEQLHERAHELCYIASSVNFPVRCEAEIRLESG